jgi:hypothetical protein
MAVPYHLDERLEGFTVGERVDREVTAELPDAGPWQRMAVLYEQVAQAVVDLCGPGAGGFGGLHHESGRARGSAAFGARPGDRLG